MLRNVQLYKGFFQMNMSFVVLNEATCVSWKEACGSVLKTSYKQEHRKHFLMNDLFSNIESKDVFNINEVRFW